MLVTAIAPSESKAECTAMTREWSLCEVGTWVACLSMRGDAVIPGLLELLRQLPDLGLTAVQLPMQLCHLPLGCQLSRCGLHVRALHV